MKIKHYMWIIIGSIIILGIFLIYKDSQKDLKILCTSDNNQPNLTSIWICMQRGDLYNQEQYDAYYNIAANNPPLFIIKDDIFYQGFALAYNNCAPDSRPYSCDRKNEEVMDNFIIKCTENAIKISFCTDYYFGNNNPNKENIKVLGTIIKNKIKEDKIRGYDSKHSCFETYKKFYKNIGKDLINLVPLEVQEACKATD